MGHISHLLHGRARRNKVATVDDVSTRTLSRIASNAHAILGLSQVTPTSAVRLIRAYFGHPDAIRCSSADRLDGRAATWRRGEDLDATFLVDPDANPAAMQRDLARSFAEYLLLLPALELPCTPEAVAALARFLTVSDRCVLDDYAAVGNDISALAGWWMLDEVDTVLRIHEVLRASMPSGIVRAAPLLAPRAEVARTA